MAVAGDVFVVTEGQDKEQITVYVAMRSFDMEKEIEHYKTVDSTPVNRMVMFAYFDKKGFVQNLRFSHLHFPVISPLTEEELKNYVSQ